MHAQRCPFERAILSTEFSCSESHKFFYAEKEGISCKTPPARLNCTSFIEHLKQNSKFVLKQPLSADGKLTHGQEMKITCGGLHGLQKVLAQQAGIHDLVTSAVDRYGDLPSLPWDKIVPCVQAYRIRQGKRQR